jgi:hypothetical protein
VRPQVEALEVFGCLIMLPEEQQVENNIKFDVAFRSLHISRTAFWVHSSSKQILMSILHKTTYALQEIIGGRFS